MSQFINYQTDDDGDDAVMVYHTRPSMAGSPDFEHRSYVKVKAIRNARRRDGSDDPDTLTVECPVPGCGTVCAVPLAGDSAAQELHVKHRKVQRKLSEAEAAQSVAEDVRAKGGEPRVGIRKDTPGGHA